MTGPTHPMSTPPARRIYTLRLDDDGRGELEVPGPVAELALGADLAPAPSLRVAIPARCVRLLLALLFAEITAAVTPADDDPRPSWRRGRPTLAELAQKLAILDGNVEPIHAEGVGTYLRTLNQKIARATARVWPAATWPGRTIPALAQQRQGGRLTARLHVPGLTIEPMQPILRTYVDRYAESLADPSLAGDFRTRLKGHSAKDSIA